MNSFIKKEHIVNKILLSILVHSGTGDKVHLNRPSHGLVFVCQGKHKYSFKNNQVYTVNENEILYLPKNSSYSVQSIVDGDVYCINFDLAEYEEYDPQVIQIENSSEILDIYKSATKNFNKNHINLVFSDLYKLLHILTSLNNTYSPKKKQSLIKPAEDYIKTHCYEEIIKMNELSKMCGISYDYLRKLFVEIYGSSPIQYINKLKIQRAKELLKSGICSVSDAAINSGFSDICYFSRQFKKIVGTNPNNYAKN